MKEPYLQVTYRHGRPFAAYYYLPRESDDTAHHSRPVEPGLVVDYASDDRAIGIEIVAPGQVTLQSLNDLLRELGCEPVAEEEFAPLHAA